MNSAKKKFVQKRHVRVAISQKGLVNFFWYAHEIEAFFAPVHAQVIFCMGKFFHLEKRTYFHTLESRGPDRTEDLGRASNRCGKFYSFTAIALMEKKQSSLLSIFWRKKVFLALLPTCRVQLSQIGPRGQYSASWFNNVYTVTNLLLWQFWLIIIDSEIIFTPVKLLDNVGII